MSTRTLESPPSILPLYARAAAPMIPGASLLPGIPGGGGEIPELELELAGVRADRRRGRRLRQGLRLRPPRPPAPDLPARPRLPAAHGGDDRRQLPVRRRRPRPRREPIIQHRRIGIDEELRSRVRPTGLEPHPKGRTFGLVTEARVDGEIVWEDDQHDAAPRRRRADPARKRPTRADAGDARGQRRVAARRRPRPPLRGRLRRPQPDPHARADREAARLPAGDRARDVDQGALPGGAREPAARRLRGRGRASASRSCCPAGSSSPAPQGDEIDFAVRDAKRGTPHLDGRVKPLEAKSKTGGSRVPTATEDKGVAERSMGLGLRALNRLAGSDLLDRIGIRKQVERALFTAHQERLPHGDRAPAAPSRPRSSWRKPARQTPGKPTRPVRPHPRRRAADAAGGRPRLRRREAPPGRARRPTTPARRRRSCSPRRASSASTMLGVPEELGGVMQRALGGRPAC